MQLCSLDTIPQENSSTFITSLGRKRLLIKQAVRNGTAGGMSVSHQPLWRHAANGAPAGFERAGGNLGGGCGPGGAAGPLPSRRGRGASSAANPRVKSPLAVPAHLAPQTHRGPAGAERGRRWAAPAGSRPARLGTPGCPFCSPWPAPARQTCPAPSWMGRKVALGTCWW